MENTFFSIISCNPILKACLQAYLPCYFLKYSSHSRKMEFDACRRVRYNGFIRGNNALE